VPTRVVDLFGFFVELTLLERYDTHPLFNDASQQRINT